MKFCDDVNGGQYENDSNSSADDKLFVLFCRSIFDCVARKGRLHSQDTVLKVENVKLKVGNKIEYTEKADEPNRVSHR